jgi:hypothetical protein
MKGEHTDLVKLNGLVLGTILTQQLLGRLAVGAPRLAEYDCRTQYVSHRYTRAYRKKLQRQLVLAKAFPVTYQLHCHQ